MLAPVHQPPPFPEIPGILDLNTLITAFLDRPEEIREFMAKWTKLKKGYEKSVKRYNEVTHLDNLIAEAEENKKATGEALEEAVQAIEAAEAEGARLTETRKDMLKAAHVEAAKIVADREAEIKTIQAGLKKSASDLRDDGQAMETSRANLDAERLAFNEHKKTELAALEETRRVLDADKANLDERGRKVAAALA